MNKRQYIFLFLLSILLYLSYIIIEYEYKKYTISSYKDEQREIIQDIQGYLNDANKIIEYKKSPAYKNKILKEQQGYKMKGEKVIYLTQEKTYNKFKNPDSFFIQQKQSISQEESITNSMTNFQKWLYFLLKKDTR